MDAETFKRRLKVGILIGGLILVFAGAITGAQWFFGAMQVVEEASHGRMA